MSNNKAPILKAVLRNRVEAVEVTSIDYKSRTITQYNAGYNTFTIHLEKLID